MITVNRTMGTNNSKRLVKGIMRDIHKGVILLIMAVLASIASLSVEDRHWKMPFITFDSPQNDDVAKLQAQLLAGLDPTQNTAPTAAGNPAKLPPVVCLKGKIARDSSADLYHNAIYVSVKDVSDTYIELSDNQILLLKSAFETQSASVISALPVDVKQRLNQAVSVGGCGQIDLYLSKIKT